MEASPLISILMPVYNGIPQMEISIKSLLWQTYTNWECIIINDGSTDETKQYLEKILNDNNERKLALEKNRGIQF